MEDLLLVQTPAAGTLLSGHGTTQIVQLKVTDASGNADSCTFTVTLEDTTDPIAISQDTTVYLGAGGTVTIDSSFVDDGSSDNCGIVTQTLDVSAFTCANVGANTVTMTVTDVAGLTDVSSSTVTVLDDTPPVAVCKDIMVQLNATGSVTITGAEVDDGSSDACGIASLVVAPNTFTCANVGPNTVTLTVTDNNGNFTTCSAVVTVEDVTPPVPICQDITIQLNAVGNASITGSDIDNGSSDACGIASLVASPNAFTCNEVGPNNVTLTVTDINGNANTCTAIVTVQDITPPVAICQPITVQLNASGTATITGNDIDNGSSDACGIASFIASPNTFDCMNVGPNTVTLTVTDNSGNTNSCNTLVTVEDNSPPVAICQDITVQLNSFGNVSILASDIDNGSVDACGIASRTVSPDAFTCDNVGSNAVTLTVTDVHGNVSTCNAIVTVQGITPPEVLCRDITVQLDVTGNATISGNEIDAGSTDACGIAMLRLLLTLSTVQM